MIQAFILLFKLLIAHAVTDFSLQSDAMAKGKNKNRKPDYIPEGQKYIPCWPYWLTAHALVSAGGVYVVTGCPVLAFLEVGFHWIFDYMKCQNLTNPHTDQALHLATKLLYVFLVVT